MQVGRSERLQAPSCGLCCQCGWSTGPTGRRCFPSDSPELTGFCTVASTQGHLVPWFPQWASATDPALSPTPTYTLSSPQWDLLLDLVCRHLFSLQTLPPQTPALCGHLSSPRSPTPSADTYPPPGTCPSQWLSSMVISLAGLPQHLAKWDSMGPWEQAQAGCRPPHHGAVLRAPSCLRQQGQPLTPGQLLPAQGPTPLPEPVGSQPLPMCPLVWAQGHPLSCHREETRTPSVDCCDRASSEGHEDRERQAGPETTEAGQLAGSRDQIPGQEEDTGETLETGKIECELYSIDTIE